MNITTTTEPSASTLPQPDIYTAISLLSISTFTCLLLYYLIFDLSFFPPNPLKASTTTILTTITTTTTLLSTTFTTLLLFNLPPNNPAIRITSAILLVLTTTTSSISNTLLLYFSLPLITIHQKPSAYFHLKTQRFLLYGIVASILLFQLPHVIVAPAAATLYKNGHWSHAVTILERISVTAYCGREILLLGCYAWGGVRYLRPVVYHHYQQYQYQSQTSYGNGRQLLYTLLMAGCVSLILNIANIVAVYVVHTAAAMAFFPFVVSTKVLVEGVAVGRLVGFVGGKSSSLQYCYHQQNSMYSVTGCGSGSQSRRGSMQPLIMQRGSAAMMSGGVGSSVGVGEGKDGGSEGEGSPGGTWGREKEWWYRSRMGSVDTVVSVAEPPVAHSAEHLVQEVVDLEGGAGVGVSRRTSVV
ncbi:hypothetical protein ABZX51_008741 [Aspergillus tubingensis]